MSKDLFVPLKKEYFQRFAAGLQNCEIRPDGHRFWNGKNVYPGRVLLLSNGYQKKGRIRKKVLYVESGPPEYVFEAVPEWHRTAVERIYGERDRWLVAYVD